jgi:signal transduction histidine kinase
VSLRTRLVLAAGYLLLVVVVALEVPLAINIERRADFETRASVIANAAFVASQISDDVFRAETTSQPVAEDVLDILRETARETRTRIVVVDQSSNLLFDTTGEGAVGEPFRREEFDVVLYSTGDIRQTVDARVRDSETAGESLLLVTAPILHERQVIGALRMSQPTAEQQGRVYRSWIGLGLIGLGVIAAGLLLAYVLAGSLARPVNRLKNVAVRLGGGDLEARSEPEGPREVATLAQSFNQMASALEASMTAQQDFVANASHQLRTPLTGLRLRLEAIEGEGGFAAQQAEKAQAELDRLAKLVQDLLALAKASAAGKAGGVVDLNDVASSAVDRWTGPADEAGKRITLKLDGAAPVWADVADLQHIVDNLVENAIKYAPAGSSISVEVSEKAGRPTLGVADDGPGIAPEDQGRVFERFYRGANGRKTGPGTGLGLAIVAELARRWGGEVRLVDRDGTCIEASFPRRPAIP